MKRILLPAATLPLLLLPLAAWAQQGEPYYHTHMWEGGGHTWFLGPLMMLVFVAVLLGAVVLLARWLGVGAGGQAAAGKGPLDILKERFARGEIDKSEFEDRRRVLGD